MGEWVVKSANVKHVKVKIYNNTTKNIFYYPKMFYYTTNLLIIYVYNKIVYLFQYL